MLLLLVACDQTTAAVAYTGDDLLADVAGYTAWDQPAAWEGLEPSCDGDHGSYVRIYLNPVAAEDLLGGVRFRDGAVIVEAAFQDTSGTPKMVVAARKVAGYAPFRGDWYWGVLGETGTEVELSGRLDACLSCHNAEDGWIRSTRITPPATRADCGDDTPDSGWAYPF